MKRMTCCKGLHKDGDVESAVIRVVGCTTVGNPPQITIILFLSYYFLRLQTSLRNNLAPVYTNQDGLTQSREARSIILKYARQD